jgi:hypothetical protein
MARIRTIKPEFPQSESMGNVSRDARLCFVMLWTIADDSGRLRGNSRMLASLLFPYDDDAPALIDGWLSELEREGCVFRYSIDGTSYLEVAKWLSHQKIDKPTPSKIPAFDPRHRILANPRESYPLDLDQRTKDQGRDLDQGSVAPSALVGSPDGDTDAKPGQVVELKTQRIPCPAVELVEVFHAECPTLPRVMSLSDARRKHLTARWREVDADSRLTDQKDGIELFRAFFQRVNESDFLSGRNGKWPACNFDWLVAPSNFLKVWEGNYDNDRRAAK